ncbi:HNH endonuclease signature motif containing protein [Pseudomonas sp. NPDC087598]|uniref:HNH endonuclease signature motif containing protein n=1 Tax=Pseudomonas sp. NPDC087598 TaxID=3364440 RepID=UPI0038110288
MGQPVSDNWLGVAATPQGAPIPTQIADKLRGREFSSFRAFRKAFWKAVGNDQGLFDQFSRLNKIDLRDGLAPSALPSEQVGKREKFEIHHIKPVSEEGAVYDIDNLTVLTPKQHIELHSKKGAM